MDRRDVERAALEQGLDHVAAINRWTGARRALLRHLPWALHEGGGAVLDVGTGSADLPRAVLRWAEARGLRIAVTAVDRHAVTLDVARRRTSVGSQVRLVGADALHLPFPTGAFDVGLLSMTLHHMDGHGLIASLAELRRVVRGGRVLVGELERALPNYLGARLLGATIWRSNPITRHDGPLSVLRAFTPGEIRQLAVEAGFRRAAVFRHPFYRIVLRAEA